MNIASEAVNKQKNSVAGIAKDLYATANILTASASNLSRLIEDSVAAGAVTEAATQASNDDPSIIYLSAI